MNLFRRSSHTNPNQLKSVVMWSWRAGPCGYSNLTARARTSNILTRRDLIRMQMFRRCRHTRNPALGSLSRLSCSMLRLQMRSLLMKHSSQLFLNSYESRLGFKGIWDENFARREKSAVAGLSSSSWSDDSSSLWWIAIGLMTRRNF